MWWKKATKEEDECLSGDDRESLAAGNSCWVKSGQGIEKCRRKLLIILTASREPHRPRIRYGWLQERIAPVMVRAKKGAIASLSSFTKRLGVSFVRPGCVYQMRTEDRPLVGLALCGVQAKTSAAPFRKQEESVQRAGVFRKCT